MQTHMLYYVMQIVETFRRNVSTKTFQRNVSTTDAIYFSSYEIIILLKNKICQDDFEQFLLITK